jgi:hypothetical protein
METRNAYCKKCTDEISPALPQDVLASLLSEMLGRGMAKNPAP